MYILLISNNKPWTSNNSNKNVDNVVYNSKKFLSTFQKYTFWVIVMASLLTYLGLKTMADWTYLYLIEYKKNNIATELMLYNEIGGIVGTLLVGFFSIVLGRLQTTILFSIISSLSLLFLHISSSSSLIEIKILLFFAGLGINGPKTLIPLTIKDYISQEYMGSISGIISLFSQLGCVISGIGIGLLIESYGWEYYLLLLSIIIIIVAILLFILLHITSNNTKKDIMKKYL